MATFDASLPASQPIVFAPRCVACEKPNPDGKIKISILGARTTPVTVLVSDAILDTNLQKVYNTNTLNKIDGIPACKGCASKLRMYHFFYKLAQYTAWIPGILLILLQKTPVWFDVTFMLLCIAAGPIYSIIYPPSFGATFLNDKANFEFRSKLVADEFKQLNNVESVPEAPAATPVA